MRYQRGGVSAPRAPLYPEWVGFPPLPNCPRRRPNPWVQDPCKHPSVLPYPAPPKVNIHRMASNHHPGLGLPVGLSIFRLSILPTLVQIAEDNCSASGLATSQTAAAWSGQTAKSPRRALHQEVPPDASESAPLSDGEMPCVWQIWANACLRAVPVHTRFGPVSGSVCWQPQGPSYDRARHCTRHVELPHGAEGGGVGSNQTEPPDDCCTMHRTQCEHKCERLASRAEGGRGGG